MKEYIEFVADRWIVALDYPKMFSATHPFDFIEIIFPKEKTKPGKLTGVNLSACFNFK